MRGLEGVGKGRQGGVDEREGEVDWMKRATVL